MGSVLVSRRGTLSPIIPAVSDPFTRANSTTSLGTATSGQAWTAVVGTWGIDTNQGYVVTHVGFDIAVVQSGRADADVSVDLPVAGSGGLVFRFVDSSNYWAVTNGGQELYKVIAGSFTSMYGGTVGADGDHLDVVLSGSSITLKRNGTTLTTVTDATFQTATKHGLFNTGDTTSRFDNFSVVPA